MKGAIHHNLLILLVAVFSILARPCIVFASQSLTSFFDQCCATEVKQVVRKRNEATPNPDDPVLLDDSQGKTEGLLPSYVPAILRKFNLQLLLSRSYFASQSVSLFKRLASVFHISPHNDHYLAVSVFRI